MKSEMSNNTLVVLLVGAMFVAMLGTLVSINNLESYNAMLTGYAVNVTNPNATLNITVTTFAHINFSRATIEFGSGYAIGSGCDLYANGSSNGADCVSFSHPTAGLILENLGDVKCDTLDLTHNASIDASVLIGGTSPTYELGYTREDTNTCTFGTDFSGVCTYADNQSTGCSPDTTTWFVSGQKTKICDDFNYTSSSDEVWINFHLFVPTDATPGTRTDTWTATCDYTA